MARIVMTAAAKNLTPVTLELGSKCPAVVDSLSSSWDRKVIYLSIYLSHGSNSHFFFAHFVLFVFVLVLVLLVITMFSDRDQTHTISKIRDVCWPSVPGDRLHHCGEEVLIHFGIFNILKCFMINKKYKM